MKKTLSLLLSVSLCLTLAACGGGKKPFSPAEDAAQLRDTQGVFTAGLTQIDQTTACALYGIDEATVTASAVYGSTTSAEELAIFTFSSTEDAETAQALLQYRVEDRKEELENYLPNELPKLDKAVIEVRKNSVLLVIAADYSGVEAFLGN